MARYELRESVHLKPTTISHRLPTPAKVKSHRKLPKTTFSEKKTSEEILGSLSFSGNGRSHDITTHSPCTLLQNPAHFGVSPDYRAFALWPCSDPTRHRLYFQRVWENCQNADFDGFWKMNTNVQHILNCSTGGTLGKSSKHRPQEIQKCKNMYFCSAIVC